jgi:hypothetical protein
VTVRCVSVELWKFCGDEQELRDRWLELSRTIQQMTNRCWQLWLSHHTQQNSVVQIRLFLDQYKRWKETGQGDKPKNPIECYPKELGKEIYHRCSAEFETMNKRTLVLLMNKWMKTLTSRKAANGVLPGWVAILLGNEQIPSFSRPLPIPFDKVNCGWSEENGFPCMILRVDRLPDSGKSIVQKCQLMVGKRKTQSVRKIVERVISGEYSFKGSALCFDRGKWFAQISYEMPSNTRSELEANKVLLIKAGKKSPWLVRFCGSGSTWKFGGSGRHVKAMRQWLQQERWSRQENYKWVGSATKGHGGKRARAPWEKLTARWKDFMKRYNHEITRSLVNQCINRGFGKVVYYQPKDEYRDKCFLAREGRDERSRMTWDWFQFGTLLKQKCDHEGITCEVRASVRAVSKTDRRPATRRGRKPVVTVQ